MEIILIKERFYSAFLSFDNYDEDYSEQVDI